MENESLHSGKNVPYSSIGDRAMWQILIASVATGFLTFSFAFLWVCEFEPRQFSGFGFFFVAVSLGLGGGGWAFVIIDRLFRFCELWKENLAAEGYSVALPKLRNLIGFFWRVGITAAVLCLLLKHLR